MFNHSKIREELYKVKALRGWSYKELADSIGASESHTHRVMKGKKFFSKDLIKEFCEVHKYNIEDFLENKTPNFDFADALHYTMQIKGKNLVDVMEMTGLNILDLSDIQFGVREPTENETKLISEVLEIGKDALDGGTLSRSFREMRVQMEKVHISRDTMDIVIQLLERDIRKPPTLKE